MKKSVLCASLLAGLMLVGCGKPAEPSSSVKPVDPSTSTEPAEVKVTKVEITGESTVEEGKDITLTATVTPDNATNKKVTWSSADATIATVDENGKVTGVKAGTVKIKAAADGKEVEHEITVTAKAPTFEEVTYELGENVTGDEIKHNDGKDLKDPFEIIEGENKITFRDVSKVYSGANDAKGNSILKLGTTKAIGTFTFDAPEGATSVVFKVAKYKDYGTVIDINGTEHTLTKNSNDGEYDEIAIDVTTNKTIVFKTTNKGTYSYEDWKTHEIVTKNNSRCAINSIIIK